MRDGPCNKEKDHRGRHSTVAWECDGCGRMGTGTPAQIDPETGWYCFMCKLEAKRDYIPEYYP